MNIANIKQMFPRGPHRFHLPRFSKQLCYHLTRYCKADLTFSQSRSVIFWPPADRVSRAVLFIYVSDVIIFPDHVASVLNTWCIMNVQSERGVGHFRSGGLAHHVCSRAIVREQSRAQRAGGRVAAPLPSSERERERGRQWERERERD